MSITLPPLFFLFAAKIVIRRRMSVTFRPSFLAWVDGHPCLHSSLTSISLNFLKDEQEKFVFRQQSLLQSSSGTRAVALLSSSRSWLQVCYVCGQTCRHECRYCMDCVICIENFIFKVLICDKTICLYCLTLIQPPSPHLTSRPFHNLVHCI